MKSNRWLLPEGIEEVLPQQARWLEGMRRRLLDLFAAWGYELVMPPFIEYLESLLIGTGHDLDLQTFKLTDQLSGRMLGIRADMTPQVARIDAHHLKRDVPTRLCYLGTVLHTRPDGFAGSRCLLQVGAELYGDASCESDVEILRLLLETMEAAGIEEPCLDLGHVGIYRGLLQQAGLDAEQEAELFDVLQRKAKAELVEKLAAWSLDNKISSMLTALVDLHGGEEVLETARTSLQDAAAGVHSSLENISRIAKLIKQHVPQINLHFDLAELRGYNYHTGVVFAVYVSGRGQAIAQGGRYDGIGQAFGHARPATGFSTDLHTLAALTSQDLNRRQGIFAPADDDPDLLALIARLRDEGECVITQLPEQQGGAVEMGCDRQLVKTSGGWKVKQV